MWDLTIMSYGQGKGRQPASAVEIDLYQDNEGNYQHAKTTLTDFLKSNNVQYRLMSDVAD